MDQLMDFKSQSEYLQESKLTELLYNLQSAMYNFDSYSHYDVGGGTRKPLNPKQKEKKAAKNKAAKKARKKNRK